MEPNPETPTACAAIQRPSAPKEKSPLIPLSLRNASLEGLPVELQTAILLHVPDIISLNGLVRSFPEYHQAYLAQRHPILQSILLNGGPQDLLYDAISVIEARQIPRISHDRMILIVRGFLFEYENKRGSWTAPEKLNVYDAINLARLQVVVYHAVECFRRSTLSKHPTSGKDTKYYEPLSRNEVRRLHRAFYRFQLCCYLFNENYQELFDLSEETTMQESRLLSIRFAEPFLDTLRPWEVEELACVRNYLRHYYGRLVVQFGADVMPRNYPRTLLETGRQLSLGPMTNTRLGFDFFQESSLGYKEENCVSRGLYFYHLLSNSPRSKQVELFKNNMRTGLFIVTGAIDHTTRSNLYEGDWSATRFKGDGDRDGPNVMWTRTFALETECNLFHLRYEPLRSWGYVFWDQERLEQWGLLSEEHGGYLQRLRDMKLGELI
ncbi:hypothetical protein MMC28_000183 [Mycoblastus sanguinarius]|nr:hypothetical protein [Mycoblastus sanguinarius]